MLEEHEPRLQSPPEGWPLEDGPERMEDACMNLVAWNIKWGGRDRTEQIAAELAEPHLQGTISQHDAVGLFWILVIFVIPWVIAVYVAKLFPQTRQWSKRWTERRERRRRSAL